MTDSSSRTGFAAIAPDPSALPYGVRPRGWMFYVALAGAILMIAFGLGLSGVLLITTRGRFENAALLTAFLPCLLFFALGAYRLWALCSPDVVLYPDRVEQRSLLGTWTALSRSEVRGVGRTISSRSGSYFEIVPQSPAARPIRLPASARTDPVVSAWLAGAHDPEAELRAADRAAVLSDPRFGATETERAANLARAKTMAAVFGVVCFCLAGWAFLSRRPYALTLGAAVVAPMVAWVLVNLSGGVLLWVGRSKARPQVGVLSAMPACGLGLASVFQNHLYDPYTIGAVAAALGLIVAVAVYTAQPATSAQQGLALVVGLAAACGVFGLISTADMAFDGAPARTFPVQVLGKHVYHGRSTRYHLSLAGWPGRKPGEVTIDSGLYQDAPVGGFVCVTHHHGAFSLPWFEVASCARGVQLPLVAPPPAAPGASAQPSGDRYYPERAQREEVQGSARLDCRVTETLTLADCSIVSETPPGYGFGAAAVARVESGQVKLAAMPPGKSRRTQTIVKFKLAP